MIVEDGLTLRVAGLELTPFCVKLVAPSNQVRFHGPVPVSVAWTVVDWLEQIVALPLTVAVGLGLTVTVALPEEVPGLHAPASDSAVTE